MDTTAKDLAERFFAAVTAGDTAAVKALCAPDVSTWQNTSGPSTLDGLVAFINAVRRVAPDMHYEKAVRVATETGFVEEHDFCATLTDGTAIRIPACVVGTVSAGLITGMREYVDGSGAGPLIKALSAR